MTVESSATQPRPARAGSLPVRVISGVVILAVVVGLLLAGRIGVIALASIAALISLWEYAGLTRRMLLPAATWIVLPLGLYATLSGTVLHSVSVAAVLGVTLLVGLSALTLVSGAANALMRWAMSIAGALYIGLPLNFYLLLYTDGRAKGLGWVLATILAVVASDVAALFVGSRLGRRPFFQHISPKKTLEGAIAGAVAPVLVTVIAARFLGIPLVHSIVLGLAIGIVAEVGDLVESQMKRRAGLKDSSNLIPGHGGILDRVDSVLFPGVLVYLYATGFHLL